MPISSCRLYKLEEEINFDDLTSSIDKKDFSENKYGLDLKTRLDITNKTTNQLWGKVIFEKPVKTSKIIENEIKIEYHKKALFSEFVFFTGGSAHFLSFSGTDASEIITSKINESIFATLNKDNVILNCVLNPNNIERFLTDNPHTPRDCSWKNLNIPGLSNCRLGGSAINRPNDYAHYNQHGEKNYIMVTLNANDLTVALYECGSIKFLNNVDNPSKLLFVQQKILPIL